MHGLIFDFVQQSLNATAEDMEHLDGPHGNMTEEISMSSGEPPIVEVGSGGLWILFLSFFLQPLSFIIAIFVGLS